MTIPPIPSSKKRQRPCRLDALKSTWATGPLLLACALGGWSPAPLSADTLSPLLRINADDPEFPWMNTGNGVRSAAISKSSGNIIVATDVNTSPVVLVLNPADGSTISEILQSDIDGNTIPGSSWRLTQVASADDGTIYGCNLDLTSSTTPRNFRLFRWESDEADVPFTLAYEGDPAGTNEETGQSLNGQRWGDSLDVMGSGENTLIVAGARALGAVALFTTTDGLTFTPHFVANVGAAAGNLGVAFGQRISNYDDPATTAVVESLDVVTVFTKLSGQQIRRAVIRLDTFAVVGTVQTFATVPTAATGIGSLPSRQLLAAVEIVAPAAAPGSGNPDKAHVFSYADATALTAIAPPATFEVDNTNGNVTGDAAFYQPPTGNTRVLVVSSNNTLGLYEIVPEVTAPAVSASPANVNVIEGGTIALTVTASGSTPLTYAWSKDGEALPEATAATLRITNVASTNAGSYQVRVSNSAGFVDSLPATVTVVPRVNTDLMTPLWSLAPGARPYLLDDDSQRSLSYNPANGHLLLLSRTVVAGLPNPALVVLDGATGEEIKDEGVLRTLDISGVSGGFFALNQVGVADDGAVFASNLVLDADGGNFKIYRWSNDDPQQPPVPAWTAASAGETLFENLRTGDTLAVTGAGTATRLAVGARNRPQFAIFTTEDGENFTAKTFEISGDGVTGAVFFQICFASESSLWAKSESGVVRLVSFDADSDPPVATIVRTLPTTQFPSTVGPVGYEPARQFLAGVSIETPDNLRLYDVSSAETTTLADQEFFPTDNPNINRTGAVDFGGGRVYALGSNNGIIALTLAPPATTTPPSLGAVALNEAGTHLSLTLTGNVGTAYRIESSLPLLATSWQTVQTVTLASPTQTVEIPLTTGEGARYYRVTTP